ncbi:polysaccharide pyruvyl transferase family protein [Bosea vestrisii]|uniref:polysaccharide pyruvyl transferase family protein n=1 Tax=Bosea vestrisii TaxID=151416 RepID=UPI0024DF93B8|nr:polysaccharide pyruvyl transferase family protein [Bosea vestrisii]WID98767.1 polysaccharide pyruvyl transferase family protein [Bosea vestrisii]
MTEQSPAPRRLRVGIVGVTLTGNMGGQAMLETVRQQLERLKPAPELRLFSIYPEADRASPLRGEMEIAPIAPVKFLAVDFSLAILANLLALIVGPRVVRRLASGHLRRIAECDAIVDLSGIAFVQGRGLPLLAYNLACCIPSFAVGVPHFKLAQSLGPFRSGYWRAISRWALTRCSAVVARGAQSARQLAEIGIKAPDAPDCSFLLDLSEADFAAARALVPEAMRGTPFVIVSPSRVTRRACEAAGVEYLGALAAAIDQLNRAGIFVAILPHSLNTDTGKNNDIAEAKELHQRIADANMTFAIDPPADAKILRAAFSEASFAITSRYHATVAALACGVPPLTISWSFKYSELLGYFAGEDLIIPAGELSAERICTEVAKLAAAAPARRTQLAGLRPQVLRRAAISFEAVMENLAAADRGR